MKTELESIMQSAPGLSAEEAAQALANTGRWRADAGGQLYRRVDDAPDRPVTDLQVAAEIYHVGPVEAVSRAWRMEAVDLLRILVLDELVPDDPAEPAAEADCEIRAL